MRRVGRFWWVLPALLLTAQAAAAQTESRKEVVAAGGGGSGVQGLRLISTVGQPCVGLIGSQAIRHFVGFLAPLGSATSSTPDVVDLPDQMALAQNFPNPFSPLTTIRFDLPESRHVRLDVFSITGRRVATLVDGELSPGRLSVSWDGLDSRGHPVASGTYIYRLSAGDFTASNRMVVTR